MYIKYIKCISNLLKENKRFTISGNATGGLHSETQRALHVALCADGSLKVGCLIKKPVAVGFRKVPIAAIIAAKIYELFW